MRLSRLCEPIAARDFDFHLARAHHAKQRLGSRLEIRTRREFYDYEAKYTPGLSETAPRAELDTVQRALVLKLARDAYRAIGAEGFARVDFLVSGEHVFISEINTIPGMTPTSLLPKAAAAAGIPYAKLCQSMVNLALRRAPKKFEKERV